MNLRLTSSALALAAMTWPAHADVTPEQVWQSWVDYYQSVGYAVTEGSRDKAGSTLTVKDVLIAGGSDVSKIAIKMPQVALSDQGDGRVKTVFAEKMTVDLSGTEPEGGTYSMPIAVELPGNSTITSGAPEDMTHEFTYPAIDVALTTMTSDGAEKPVPVNVNLVNSAGTFHIAAGAPNKYTYDMTSEKVTFQGDVSDDTEGKVGFAGSIDGLKAAGNVSAMEDFADLETQMNAALKNGFSMDGTLVAGAMATTLNFSGQDDAGMPSTGMAKYDGKGFNLGFSLSKDGMSYQAGSDAVAFEMTSQQIPFPVRYAMDNASLDINLPVMQQPEAQPFKLAYALSGVTLGDEIWAMFDPEAKLKREPASLDLDVTGQMKVVKDLFDMTPPADDVDATPPADATDDATAEGMTPDAPADDAEAQANSDMAMDETAAEPSALEPVEVSINQIALKMLGATVNATGALTAPEGGDMTTPLGTIKAEYEGVNTLLDTLGAMGLIPQDQMSVARMMLAMFAKPVEGSPDKMTTDLEFKDGGTVFANGQQIK